MAIVCLRCKRHARLCCECRPMWYAGDAAQLEALARALFAVDYYPPYDARRIERWDKGEVSETVKAKWRNTANRFLVALSNRKEVTP